MKFDYRNDSSPEQFVMQQGVNPYDNVMLQNFMWTNNPFHNIHTLFVDMQLYKRKKLLKRKINNKCKSLHRKLKEELEISKSNNKKYFIVV